MQKGDERGLRSSALTCAAWCGNPGRNESSWRIGIAKASCPPMQGTVSRRRRPSPSACATPPPPPNHRTVPALKHHVPTCARRTDMGGRRKSV